MLSKESAAWLAGFWEGEGSIKGAKGGFFVLNASQVNREPLDKFQELCGFGKIYGPRPNPGRPNSKPIHTFSVSSFEHVQQIVIFIWPYLSRRRKDQIVQCFKQLYAGYAERKDKQKFCRKQLHLRTPENTYTYRGKRQCRKCSLTCQRLSRARRKAQI